MSRDGRVPSRLREAGKVLWGPSLSEAADTGTGRRRGAILLREARLAEALIRFDGEVLELFTLREGGSLRFHREFLPFLELGPDSIRIELSSGAPIRLAYPEDQAPALEELVADVRRLKES